MAMQTGNRRTQRPRQKQVELALLFFAVAVVLYWLSVRIFMAQDCEFFGSKLALVIVPACAVLGNQAAAAIPFVVACALLLMAVLSYTGRRL